MGKNKSPARKKPLRKNMNRTIANPYKYTGPLDPGRDKLVVVPRDEIVNQIIEGLKKGDYWGIYGLRQIGKTTLLHQIGKKYRGATHIYINFQVVPTSEKLFYQSLMDILVKEIPCEPWEDMKWNNYDPDFRFIKFLEESIPQKRRGKYQIVLHFDEIEAIPFVGKFLHLWRKVYHDRDHNEKLRKYAVIITGSAELTILTRGKNSPFNIARYLYMNDFTPGETRDLIAGPMNQLGIGIEPDAIEMLIDRIGGHPQMLQHACSILVENAGKYNRQIIKQHVDDVINILLIQNATISTLEQDLASPELEMVLKRILNGNAPRFHLYKNFSVSGAGCIVEGNNQECRIRNKVYERVIKDRLGITDDQGTRSPGINEFNEKEEKTDRLKYPSYLEEDQSSRYAMIENIGKGGMGSRVVKAADKKMQRLVALKLIRSSWFERFDDMDSFFKEAQTTGRLSHPNIVTVYDCGRIADDFFISMEFIDGIALDGLISKEHLFTLPEILYLAKQILNGLEYAHRNSVIHRDIKPRNIMVANDGKVKIVDFGIAALRVLGKTGDTGIQKGTPAYMAPEQFFAEKTDQRTDIYSFGVTMFEVACSRLPYRGASKDSMARGHIGDGIPLISQYRPDLPGELERIICNCMAKDPIDRYQVAREVLEVIDRLFPDLVDERSMQEALRQRLLFIIRKMRDMSSNKD